MNSIYVDWGFQDGALKVQGSYGNTYPYQAKYTSLSGQLDLNSYLTMSQSRKYAMVSLPTESLVTYTDIFEQDQYRNIRLISTLRCSRGKYEFLEDDTQTLLVVTGKVYSDPVVTCYNLQGHVISQVKYWCDSITQILKINDQYLYIYGSWHDSNDGSYEPSYGFDGVFLLHVKDFLNSRCADRQIYNLNNGFTNLSYIMLKDPQSKDKTKKTFVTVEYNPSTHDFKVVCDISGIPKSQILSADQIYAEGTVINTILKSYNIQKYYNTNNILKHWARQQPEISTGIVKIDYYTLSTDPYISSSPYYGSSQVLTNLLEYEPNQIDFHTLVDIFGTGREIVKGGSYDNISGYMLSLFIRIHYKDLTRQVFRIDFQTSANQPILPLYSMPVTISTETIS